MNLYEFQELAVRTAKPEDFRSSLSHSALGLTGEAGEYADAVKKHIHYGKPLDLDNMVEELGDIMWYAAFAANVIGVPLTTIAELNIEKLRQRYPAAYSDFHAAARLDKEVA